MKFADSEYRDYYEDLDHIDEQDELAGLWEDFKTRILKPVWNAFKPALPETIGRVITPPATVTQAPQIIERQVVEKPTLPTWVIPVGIGLVAITILPMILKRK